VRDVKRGFLSGLSVVAIVVAQLLVTPAAPAASHGLTVAKPRPDQLLAGHGKVVAVLRTAPKLRKLDVKLEGGGVGKAFKQVRPGTWRAQLARKRLRAGANVIVATSVDRAGRRDFVSGRFYLGERRRGFLTVENRRRIASSLVARVRMRRLPNLRFRAKLNGRNVSRLFRRSFLRKRTAHLGANDGLRFGRNVLKVFAARRDGSFDIERRVIFARHDRPLVVAGPDRFLAGGKPIVLDGRRSHASLLGSNRGAATASRSFDFRWSVLRRPKGSKARPATSGSPRTRFRPDVVGTYRLRLTATDPSGARGSDVVTVTEAENAPPIGIPIETIVPQLEGGATEFAMKIGSEEFPLLHEEPELDNVQAVFLDRGTLEVLGTANYKGSSSDAAELKGEVERYGQQALVIISNPGALPNMEVSSAFGPVIKMLGTTWSPPTFDDGGMLTAGWSVIGVPGSGDGAIVSAGGGAPSAPNSESLRGYLARDSSGLYSFVAAPTVPFDTDAPGAPAGRNRVEIGGEAHESGPLACGEAKGGFQVLVLEAEPLEQIVNETFTTNGCGLASDAGEVARMAELISALSSPGPTAFLYFVQSIGSPFDPAVGPFWSTLASSLGKIGGTDTVAGSATESYALVGATGIADFPLTEASQSLTGRPAQISGLLRQGDLGSYSPLLTSPTGTISFELAEIAYQPAQPWPYSETAGQKAALAYIAGLLELPKPTPQSSCYVPPQPDVRSEYCNETLRNAWAGYVGQIRSAQCNGRCQDENGFSQEDWENVRAELVGRGQPNEFSEFNAVQSTWGLVEALQKPFGASGVSAEVDLNAIATKIEQALKPPPENEATGDFLNILGTILYTGSYIEFEDPAAAIAIGAIAGGIGIGSLYTKGENGAAELENFQVRAAEVAVELAKSLKTGSDGIDSLGELVVTDYGKLRRVKENFAGFTPKAVEAAAERLETGMEQWSYKTLFGAAYEAVSLVETEFAFNAPLPSRAHDYTCRWAENSGGFGPIEGEYRPFNASPVAEYRLDGPPPVLWVLIERGSRLPSFGGREEKPISPPESLFGSVYTPLSQGGFGMHPPWFWREVFGFPSAEVRAVEC
jgi:hypothetical protein